MKREEIISALEAMQQKVKSSQHPSQLEVDILKDGIKELYNKLIAWEGELGNEPTPEATEMHVVQPEEPVAPVPTPEPAPQPAPPVIEEPPKVEEPDITPSYEEAVQPPVVEPEPPTPDPEPEIQEPVVAQAEKKDHTVAERLEEGKEDNTLAGKWNKTPLMT